METHHHHPSTTTRNKLPPVGRSASSGGGGGTASGIFYFTNGWSLADHCFLVKLLAPLIYVA